MMRPARMSEIKERFPGVDSDVLWDICMADLCFVNPDTDEFVVDNITQMFALILRQAFPEAQPEITDYDDRD